MQGTQAQRFDLTAIRLIAVAVVLGILRAAAPDDFVTVRGSDPCFAGVMASGRIPRGRNSGDGFKGSAVKVDRRLLSEGPNARRKIEPEIRIHTIGSSFIHRSDFPK